jgi:hypothetical protein
MATVRNGIGWLTTSSAEIARARGVIQALRQPGVIDELGFLMLNGAFAERLYPGVTTIMTRARYLVFIPAIYSFIEQSGRGVNRDVDKLARDLQFELRNALEKNEQNFIGKERGRDLARTPANVYWTSLGVLGVATRRISEGTYQRQIAQGLFDRKTYRDDDDAAHSDESEALWTGDLRLSHVLPGGAFPASTSFRLRRSEAAFLESRYAGLRPGGNEMLVTTMVRLGRRLGPDGLEGMRYPWDVPDVSAPVDSILQHARRLSLLARGTTLQYYRMLIEKKGADDPGVANAFETWWGAVRSDLDSWDLDAFFRMLALWNAGRGLKDRRFIEGWTKRALELPTGRAILDDRAARQLIGSRETDVRPGKQRLRVKRHLDSWRAPERIRADDHHYMDYRHSVGRQIAEDIVDGLERGAQ